MVRSRLIERKAKARGTKAGQAGLQIVSAPRDKPGTERYVVSERLRNVLDDVDATATARVAAARILAEMEGLVGRHQAAPSRGADLPLSTLSRDQLAGELDRLRALVSLGLVPEP